MDYHQFLISICVPSLAVCRLLCLFHFVFWIVFKLFVHSMDPDYLNSLPDLRSTNSVWWNSPESCWSHRRNLHRTQLYNACSVTGRTPPMYPSHNDFPGKPFPAKTAVCPFFFNSFSCLILLWQKQYMSTVETLENIDNQKGKKKTRKENLSPSHTPGNF